MDLRQRYVYCSEAHLLFVLQVKYEEDVLHQLIVVLQVEQSALLWVRLIVGVGNLLQDESKLWTTNIITNIPFLTTTTITTFPFTVRQQDDPMKPT